MLCFVFIFFSFCRVPKIATSVFLTEVTFLWIMRKYRPDLRILIEQPISSFMFKIPMVQRIWKVWGLKKILTYQGLFGGPMLKGTHLLTNMSKADLLERHATADAKRKFKKRMAAKMARLQKKGKAPPVYWKRLAKGKFQGGPNLAESAVYPHKFCASIVDTWEQSHPSFMSTDSLPFTS